MAAKSKPDDKKPVGEQSPDQKDLQAPEALQSAAIQADQQSGPTGSVSDALTPEPEPEPEPDKVQYLVTSRSDVLHNGDLYTEGEPLWLDQDEAYPLLRNGCIKPKDGAR
ncbi:hypothetical protein [Pseudomonas sp. microsymbiont 2]